MSNSTETIQKNSFKVNFTLWCSDIIKTYSDIIETWKTQIIIGYERTLMYPIFQNNLVKTPFLQEWDCSYIVRKENDTGFVLHLSCNYKQ